MSLATTLCEALDFLNRLKADPTLLAQVMTEVQGLPAKERKDVIRILTAYGLLDPTGKAP